MKIVNFLGGLGNQMFQYAFYSALKNKFKNVKADLGGFKGYQLHNGYELDRVFGIQLDHASTLEIDTYYNPKNKFLFRNYRKIFGLDSSVYHEILEFNYDSLLFHDWSSRYYIGYWQNEKYFTSFRDRIQKDFKFKTSLVGVNAQYNDEIESSNSVAVHIRRGDYVGHTLHGGICTIDYYISAIKRFNENLNNPTFFVFSNDIDWCKKNLPLKSGVYVKGNLGKNSWIDMQLMSKCKHQIIANSSFSWWSAWLNPNPKKIVIAPSKWINSLEVPCDIIPNTWVKI